MQSTLKATEDQDESSVAFFTFSKQKEYYIVCFIRLCLFQKCRQNLS